MPRMSGNNLDQQLRNELENRRVVEQMFLLHFPLLLWMCIALVFFGAHPVNNIINILNYTGYFVSRREVDTLTFEMKLWVIGEIKQLIKAITLINCVVMMANHYGYIVVECSILAHFSTAFAQATMELWIQEIHRNERRRRRAAEGNH